MNLTLLGHLRELRSRLMWIMFFYLIACGVAYFAFDYLIAIIYHPFESASRANTTLYVTSLMEGFLTKFKFSFVGGGVLVFPIILFHVVRFVFPGLTPRERTILGASIISSVFLALLSLFLTYHFLLPYTIRFMTSPEFVPESVGILLNYHDNVFYILNLLMYSMLAFQFPILLEVCMALNLVSRKTLYKATRYVIVLIFVIAAIVTPPEPVSQMCVALPMIGLYFLTLLVAKIFGFGDEKGSV